MVPCIKGNKYNNDSDNNDNMILQTIIIIKYIRKKKKKTPKTLTEIKQSSIGKDYYDLTPSLRIILRRFESSQNTII